MEVADFVALSSSIQEEIDAATDTIISRLEDPQYVVTLLDLLNKAIMESSEIAMHNIVFALSKMIKKNKFNYSNFVYIAQNLFRFLYQVPYKVSINICNCFLSIYAKCTDIFDDYINQCLSQDFSTLEIIGTSLHFVQLIMPYTSNFQNNIEFPPVLFRLLINFNTRALNDLTNDASAQIFKNSIYMFITTLIKVHDAFRAEGIDALFHQINDILCIEYNTEEFISMKSYILEVCMHDLFFHYCRIGSLSENKLDFAQYIINEICPLYIDTLIKLVGIDPLKSLALDRLSEMMTYDIALDTFLSEEFFCDIIFHSSRLTGTDIALFDEIPEQFMAFCISAERSLGNGVVRSVLKKYVQISAKKSSEFAEFMARYLSEEALDELDLENRIFLLSAIYEIVEYSQNSGIDELNYFSEIAVNTESNIVAISALNVLKILVDNCEYDPETLAELTEISLYFLTESENILVKLMSSKLFFASFDPDIDSIEAHTSIEKVINSLLEIISSLQDSAPPTILSHIISISPESALPHAVETLQSLMEQWGSIVESSSDPSESSSLLVSASACIDALPSNTFTDAAEFIIQFVHTALTEYSEANMDEYLFNILRALSTRLDPIPELLFDTLEVINANIIKYGYDYILDAAPFIISIINTQAFFELDLVGQVVQIFDSVVQATDLNKPILTALFILTAIVQCGQIAELSLRAMDFMNELVPPLQFLAASVLLTSGMLINENVTMNVPDELLSLWLDRAHSAWKCDARVIRYTAAAMFLFAKLRGNIDAAHCGTHMAALIARNFDDRTVEVGDIDENEDDVFDEFMLMKNELPMDTINMKELFENTVKQTELVNELDPNMVKDIENMS